MQLYLNQTPSQNPPPPLCYLFKDLKIYEEVESLESFYRTYEKETILYGFETHIHHTNSSSTPLVKQIYTVSIDLSSELS